MTFFQEYALLIAVSLPVLVIVAIQVWLFIAGERGTLLLPSSRPFDSIVLAEEQAEDATVEASPMVIRHAAPARQAIAREVEREAA